ncbi:glycosyltransferase [Cyclobacterium sp. 1_MG-2023]|uniref:glycosyltransferase n=1 Tax=Cyclobacterium sp. 1_MG-2023 TaxID=3062681 RepID=UPI0026E231F9|nr:glycosyltransferase [Cyclobacterium sp. 1_MG-2023]MDO6437218.1 glycosyltransferase [Cyclobacterium sp. 1_MG-2023]
MLALGICYFLFAVGYTWGLYHLGKSWEPKTSDLTQSLPSSADFCILVPFRNEERNLKALLPNLFDSLPFATKVIFIDDDSEDGGVALIRSFIQAYGIQNWFVVPSIGQGKKAALNTGVEASHSKIILTIDADISLSKGWIKSMLTPFNNANIQLVAGPVMTHSANGIFYKFQQIEWASLLLISNYFFKKGHPLMCSGANLAFRTSAFEEVAGYTGNFQIPSGDDEFLLKKLNKRYGADALVYLNGPSALVQTQPLASPGDWIRQRSRWASKWNAHGEKGHRFTAVLLAFFCLIVLSSIPLAFYSWKFTYTLILVWSLKYIAEKVVLGKVLKLYGLKFSNINWFLAGWIYPLMVLATLPYAILGKYTWKGRKN